MEEKTGFSLLAISIMITVVFFSPLRTLMRRTAMLMSGCRIALAILATGTLLTILVPAQIPTTIEVSSMNSKSNGYGFYLEEVIFDI